MQVDSPDGAAGSGGRARMRTSRTSRRAAAAALAFAVATLRCGGAAPLAPTPPLPVPTPTPAPPKVLIISLDGLRPDSLAPAGAIHIPGLMRRGTSGEAAQTVFPPTTLPSHGSMLTGFLPRDHGMIWDDWKPERGLVKVPTIFSVAKAAGLRTVAVVGKEKLRHIELPGTLDEFRVMAGDEVALANEAVVQIMAGFDLMFVHLPEIDMCGHRNSWMSQKYLLQVVESDRAVGRILSALPRETTVILTADHGGHGSTHGLDQASDMIIPWVIAGPGVIEGAVLPLTLKLSTMDTGATALYVLGLSLPPKAGGRAVVEAFRNGAGALRPAS